MVVQHNLQAMNSNRMLNLTNKSVSKSTEKLSSGYRINRAADDAAGLAISEKMRKQIKGLTQASSNAQDGISCVQTAEGALGEVEDMLQRMNQLAVQAANGTNSVSDRQNIQDEIDQLVTEIDRVAETTKFNETYLLKGAIDGGKQSLGQYTYKEYSVDSYTLAGANPYYDASGNTISAKDLAEFVNVDEAGNVTYKDNKQLFSDTTGTARVTANEAVDVKFVDSKGNEATEGQLPVIGVQLADGASDKFFILDDDGNRKYITDGNIDDYVEFDAGSSTAFDFKDGVEIKYESGGEIKDASAASVAQVEHGVPSLYDADGTRISENRLAEIMKLENPVANLYLETGDSLQSMGMTAGAIASYITTSQQEYADALQLTFHVGSEAQVNNKIHIDIDSMSSVQLGVDILSSTKNGIVDIDGQSATDAIKAIADAINKVSAQRSELGAIQNRLEHTINNLDNVVENTTAAESQIRDTDMASEMVKYSNQNILAQAGQSMLAQANQANQGVMSLLG